MRLHILKRIMRQPFLLHDLLPRLRVLRPRRPLRQCEAEAHFFRWAVPQRGFHVPRVDDRVFAFVFLWAADLIDAVPAGEFGPETVEREGAAVRGVEFLVRGMLFEDGPFA